MCTLSWIVLLLNIIGRNMVFISFEKFRYLILRLMAIMRSGAYKHTCLITPMFECNLQTSEGVFKYWSRCWMLNGIRWSPRQVFFMLPRRQQIGTFICSPWDRHSKMTREESVPRQNFASRKTIYNFEEPGLF